MQQQNHPHGEPPQVTAPRPRRPTGPPPGLRDRLRADPELQVRAVIVGAGALIVVAILVILSFVLLGGGGGTGGDDATGGDATMSDAAGGDSTATEPLVLPLDLAAVGFAEGTVEETALDEGPDAPSYCNTRPTTEGLREWRGNRLTEQDGRRRVAQMVSRFRSSLDAAAHLESTAAAVDCETWRTGQGDAAITFQALEGTPSTIFGDATRRFDLRATTSGPDLFLRTLMVRSGREVAQFTYVSANQQDLGLLDDLVAVAVTELGY
ncbi:MAG: hypothetical protein ACFCVK_10990 [Acidimicrobiales bacterium]